MSMLLSVSNIAWSASQDEEMYQMLKQLHYNGLEVAPTRLFANQPYNKLDEAARYSEYIKETYGLVVPSIQSIWYGKNEKVYGSEVERNSLIEYTTQAVAFACNLGAHNLVFGSPKNRVVPANGDEAVAFLFFQTLGEAALNMGTTISLEPNPPLYGTNFLNTTSQAFDFVKHLNHPAVKVNIDFGTLIENKEDFGVIDENINLVNHVHISEPNLVGINQRAQHKELASILKARKYTKFVSVEMRQGEELSKIKEILYYIREIFL